MINPNAKTGASLRLMPLDVEPSPRGPNALPLPRPSRRAHLKAVPAPRVLPEALRRRDPAFIRRVFPLVASIADHWYRGEVQGAQHLPDQKSLIISTHNGGYHVPDLAVLTVAYWRRFGLETPLFGMAHQALFQAPLVAEAAYKLGSLYACQESAAAVLDAGYPLLICPGGDEDALKPFSQRHQITFGRRRGFIRIALQHQVPIVPVVSVGAHEVVYMLGDGQKLARLIGFTRLFRIKTVPLALSIPFGLTPAGIFSLPLPSKVTVRVLPPIHLGEPPEAAQDPLAVERCFERVRATMQAGLDDLASQRRLPVLG